MRTQDGLLDVLALGCVLEFATSLHRDRYVGTYDPATDAACEAQTREDQARTWYRVLLKTFAAKHAIIIEKRMVHVSYLAHSVMVGFAAAVINYMKDQREKAKFAPGQSPSTVEQAMRHHLQEDHPHLVAALDLALVEEKPRCQLTWAGSSFQVVVKSKSFDSLTLALGMPEQRELASCPLYPSSEMTPGYDCAGAEDAVNGYYGGFGRERISPTIMSTTRFKCVCIQYVVQCTNAIGPLFRLLLSA